VSNEPSGRSSPIWRLSMARLYEFLREPEAVFWTYCFPMIMVVILGLSFRNKPIEKIDLDVVEGSTLEIKALEATGKFKITVLPESESLNRLRTAKTPLVVKGDGVRVVYTYDPDVTDARAARAAVDEAIQRAAGRTDPVPTSEHKYQEPGGRYVDFLVPGLIGMGVMGGGLWGLGFVIVDMRIRKLLKRFLATPMRKSDFLMSLMISRFAFLIPEVTILLLFAYLAFDVPIVGSLWEVILVILIGAMAFSGLGLLIASRAKTIEAVSGLMNLVMVPMWTMSGIFFSSERLPEVMQPFVKILPMTLMLDALRPIMLEGASIMQHMFEIGMLVVWTVVTFVVALRIFRWT
jgi:ABC-2 type transport system permease protein